MISFSLDHLDRSDTQNTAAEFDPFGPLPEVSLIEIGDGISGLLVSDNFLKRNDSTNNNFLSYYATSVLPQGFLLNF